MASTRSRALGWLKAHRGMTEQPPNSNTDNRPDGIRRAQVRLGGWLVGQPWCGVWAASALMAAGVQGVTWRLASVALIEDDARAGRGPFRSWIARPSRTSRAWRRNGEIRVGDLVVMYGRGVHVETLRSKSPWLLARGYVLTDGGNTSSGTGGSQSNGGGAFLRKRRVVDIHGVARVRYPGDEPLSRRSGRLRALAAVVPETQAGREAVGNPSDMLLFADPEVAAHFPPAVTEQWVR